MEGLAQIDGWTLVAILAKAAGYIAALLAMGGPLFIVTFRKAPDDVLWLARKIAVLAALSGLSILALRFGIRAARISGMGMSGAVDPMMLGFVWDSPLGVAALWRSLGELLVLGLLIPGISSLCAGLVGAVLIATSYTFIGHSLGEPRWLLVGLLTVHLLAAAFWFGALGPLHRAAGHPDGGTLLHRFGIIASATVAILILVGVTFAWLMIGSIAGLITSAYGWILLAKLSLVAGLMGLAAFNRWRFVPALMSGRPGAATSLRSSIKTEAVVVVLTLTATATLTTISTPPVNL